ncbi:uncharacterized protein LOC126799356 [Argentina anserina]|uniref:uncharacterized protein LOC126799356 n=1 Tax=Argentina anserina TaxID=57926 RepID=UPI00217673DA|nr:uncharacterized protein LOC126799356 [Potentilla anserina]
MSVLDKEISSSSRDDDEEEEDDENGGDVNERCRCRGKDRKKQSSKIGFSRNLGKAKQVVLFPFTKAKKQLPRRNRGAASSCSPFSSGKRFGVSGGNAGCYLCFMPPLNVDSSAESPSSDPNSPNFTHGKLRSLIEKNDFYSRECNYHLDFDAKSPC